MLGAPPAQFVHRLRLEAARRRLEESSDGVEQIAADWALGFSPLAIMTSLLAESSVLAFADGIFVNAIFSSVMIRSPR